MTGFLDALGKKLAEQWVTLLVLPGVLWVGVTVVAIVLGQHHALDPRVFADSVNSWTQHRGRPEVLVPLLAGVLLAGAAAGLTASWLGAAARRLWMVRGRWWPAHLLTRWRHRRWLALDRRGRAYAVDAIRASTPGSSVVRTGPELAETFARRDRIGLLEPARPTWTGDRWYACAVRLDQAYGLDLSVVWPRLWTVLPESIRTDIATTQSSLTIASNLVGWAVLYGVLGLWWWPGFFVGMVILATGVTRARSATGSLCLLVEAAADLHGHTLAQQLRIPCDGRVSRDIGEQISAALRKDAVGQGSGRDQTSANDGS